MSLSLLLAILEIGVLVGALFYLASKFNGKETIILAEAGPMDQVDEGQFASTKKEKKEYIKTSNGDVRDTSEMLRIQVVGKCMEPKNMFDGEQYYVRKVDKSADLRAQIKPKDVLLIYYPPKKIYKIRVFEKFADGDDLITYRYDVTSREKVYSTKRHKRENVKGVVSYPVKPKDDEDEK